jgi:DNA-binding protein HU-beta
LGKSLKKNLNRYKFNENGTLLLYLKITLLIAEGTGLERNEAQKAVEAFMTSIKTSLTKGQNVYLRGFGSFIVKERAEKTGRNISKNTTIIIPAHNIPAFKPAKTFVDEVKNKQIVK